MKLMINSEIAGQRNMIMNNKESGFLPNGRLHIADFATTSPIVAAKATDDTVVFTTRSGSTYTVAFGKEDFGSYFSLTLLSMVKENPAFAGLVNSDLLVKIRTAA